MNVHQMNDAFADVSPALAHCLSLTACTACPAAYHGSTPGGDEASSRPSKLRSFQDLEEQPNVVFTPVLAHVSSQLYLEDVYEVTGYRLAADSGAALRSGGGRRHGGGGVVAHRDKGLVQVSPP